MTTEGDPDLVTAVRVMTRQGALVWHREGAANWAARSESGDEVARIGWEWAPERRRDKLRRLYVTGADRPRKYWATVARRTLDEDGVEALRGIARRGWKARRESEEDEKVRAVLSLALSSIGVNVDEGEEFDAWSKWAPSADWAGSVTAYATSADSCEYEPPQYRERWGESVCLWCQSRFKTRSKEMAAKVLARHVLHGCSGASVASSQATGIWYQRSSFKGENAGGRVYASGPECRVPPFPTDEDGWPVSRFRPGGITS